MPSATSITPINIKKLRANIFNDGCFETKSLMRSEKTTITPTAKITAAIMTHTSLTILVDYRSPRPELSWVNAAGAMMDAAAIVRSSVAIPLDVQADLMIRAGYLALRRIGHVFGLNYNPHPSPDEPTSITRAMYDEAIEVLAQAGVPIIEDREHAWRDFNGWRVNYDEALRGLERLTIAPTGWWELPKRSAWDTDEPLAEEATRHGVATGPRNDRPRLD